eukprot:8796654-Karenia_brevis.AAC.1
MVSTAFSMVWGNNNQLQTAAPPNAFRCFKFLVQALSNLDFEFCVRVISGWGLLAIQRYAAAARMPALQ